MLWVSSRDYTGDSTTIGCITITPLSTIKLYTSMEDTTYKHSIRSSGHFIDVSEELGVANIVHIEKHKAIRKFGYIQRFTFTLK
jgi:hypothetical protein